MEIRGDRDVNRGRIIDAARRVVFFNDRDFIGEITIGLLVGPD